MVSIRGKALKKERRRQEEIRSMMQGMVWVIIVSFVTALLLVKVFFVLQPYLVEMMMSPFQPTQNPYFKDDLDIGMFKKLYLQSFPVLFPSSDRELILDRLANRTQFHCSANQNLESDHETNDENFTQSLKCIKSPLCEVIVEDDASVEFGRNVERNILSIPEVQEAIQIPRLPHSFTGEMVRISNLSTPIQMILSELTADSVSPIFRQLPQSWELLIHGRKKWYFYKPGQFPMEGFDPGSSLQDWLHEVLPTLSPSHQPIEMIQEEGHAIYVPEGWFQASLPLPHPQGHSAFLAPLLSSIQHHSHKAGNVCESPALDSSHESLRHESSSRSSRSSSSPSSILTLSLRQRGSEPEVSSSLFFQTSKARAALAERDYHSAIEILRAATKGHGSTEFSSTYLLGQALFALIEEQLSQSHSSHRRESKRDEGSLSHDKDKELIEEAERVLKRSISLNRLDVSPHVSLIELLLKLKRYAEAETALKAALLLGFSDRPELQPFKYIFNIGH